MPNGLIIFTFTLILFGISIPIHELGHLMFFKLTGCKNNLSVKWIQFKPGHPSGYVKNEDGNQWSFPDTFKNHYKVFAFFLGFSGGLVSGLSMLIILYSLSYFYESVALTKSLHAVIFTQFTYGIYEGFVWCRGSKLVEKAEINNQQSI